MKKEILKALDSLTKKVKNILHKVSLRDFFKEVIKTNHEYKEVIPLDKDYAANALTTKENATEKELVIQAAGQEKTESSEIHENVQEKIEDKVTIEIISTKEHQGEVIETIEYMNEEDFYREMEEGLYGERFIDSPYHEDNMYSEIDTDELEDESSSISDDESKNLSADNKLLLELNQKYFNVSAPVIENYEDFFDIFRKLSVDNDVDFEIKYNPLGFGDRDYYFMYVNTYSDEYKSFCTFDEVRKYMSSESIEKFESVSEKIENIRLVMNELPVQFYSDENLMKMMLNHFENETTVTLVEFYQQVNTYVVEVQKSAIKVDLKKTGLKVEEKLVHRIMELNKATKNLNTIEDIKNNKVVQNSDTKELLKDINKSLQYQMNRRFELQM